MEPTKPSSAPSTNPPSVEAAYKRKCIALKKRLGELEDENELMRVRNQRGWQYIQKMRLESCILLERLAETTGMGNELDVSMAGPDSEYDKRLAKATARMKYGNLAASGNGGPSRLGDETEGSSEEQPLTPQPQERPLRIKRPKKENEKDNEGQDEQESTPGQQQQASTSGDQQAGSRRPTQDEMTSSFRVQTGSNENGNGNEDEAPSTANKDETNDAQPSTGDTKEHESNGTAPETTEDSQSQQQQEQQQGQSAPSQQSEPAAVPEDNTTTPMDMDTTEEQKES